jgi:hypothetical protein
MPPVILLFVIIYTLGLLTAFSSAFPVAVDPAVPVTVGLTRWEVGKTYVYSYDATSTVAGLGAGGADPSTVLSRASRITDEGNAGTLSANVAASVCCGRRAHGSWSFSVSLRLHNVTLAGLQGSPVPGRDIARALEAGAIEFALRSDGSGGTVRFVERPVGGSALISAAAIVAAAPLKRSVADVFRFVDPASVDGGAALLSAVAPSRGQRSVLTLFV